MLFAELPSVLLRRWYLVALGLLATLGLSVWTTSLVPVRYSAQAEVLLLPPRTTTGLSGNPYVDLGGLGPTRDVWARALSDPTVQERLVEQSALGKLEVSPDLASPAPLAVMTVEAATPQAALSLLAKLLDESPRTLRSLQSDLDVPEAAFITSTVVTRSSTAMVVRKPQIRALLVVVGVGIGATLLAAAAGDALLFRLRGTPKVRIRTVKASRAAPGDGQVPPAPLPAEVPDWPEAVWSDLPAVPVSPAIAPAGRGDVQPGVSSRRA